MYLATIIILSYNESALRAASSRNKIPVLRANKWHVRVPALWPLVFIHLAVGLYTQYDLLPYILQRDHNECPVTCQRSKDSRDSRPDDPCVSWPAHMRADW